jgi:hypothetical protein
MIVRQYVVNPILLSAAPTIKEDFIGYTGNDKASNGLPKTEDIVRNQADGEIDGPMDVIKPRQELCHHLLRKR